MCDSSCSEYNTKYVAVLNNLTRVLKEALLGSDSTNYNVLLIACDSQEGRNQGECQLNYQIMINGNLETLVNEVSQVPYADQKINYFVAFMILLQLHSKSVPSYGLWLIDEYEIDPKNFLSKNSDCGNVIRDVNNNDKKFLRKIERLRGRQLYKAAFIEIFKKLEIIFACLEFVYFLQAIFYPKKL